MIYLTVITEEVLSSTGIGRWYDDEYEDKTTIIRYLFCFNPNNEKLYFHNLKYFKNGIILEKDTYRKLKELFTIKELGYTIKDSEWGFPSIEESGNYSYEHYGRTSIHRRQFIDKKATYELCQFLNDGLDFTLYCPCISINPNSTTNFGQTIGGTFTKYNYPQYLPTPYCRILDFGVNPMERVILDDFISVPYDLYTKNKSNYIPVEIDRPDDD